MRFEIFRKKIFVFSIILILSFGFLGIISNTTSGQDSLADEYAPILYFEAEETCYPVNAQYHIDNSDYTCLSSDEEYCYYDNVHGTTSDNGVINHYQNEIKNPSSNYYNDRTVYYRTYSDTSTGSNVVQYWFFYAFNKGELNQHEGDWEMVEVIVPQSGNPWVAYSQHHSGQSATWDQVEKEGNHIKVYVARGSHANYLRSYSGKIGVANDIVGANGDILKPSNYNLVNIQGESWLDFSGRWGELAEDTTDAVEAVVLGQAGPQGPKYREDGSMWNDPTSWGQNLMKADNNMFLAEWFIYNFVLIFILITAISLALSGFFIYRKHKKYGLGPRIFSFLYIDGLNLKSIGNILCIVGIIIAIIGLFNNWYYVSYDLSDVTMLEGINTDGMTDLLSFDGINGLQVTIPGQNGMTPIGNIAIPFSLLIFIGLVFLIISTIGIHTSRKIAWKYIWRGVKILIPFILLVIVIMVLGGFIPDAVDTGGASISEILNTISSNPFGSEQTFVISAEGVSVSVPMRWGLGLGAVLLLISGIILIISGILEFIANKQFYQTKMPIEKASKKMKSASTPQPIQQTPSQPPQQTGKFCTECGANVPQESEFCPNCGKKIK